MADSSSVSKREAVESMFDSIAWRYDFLNHFLSFGTDKLWRRKAVRTIGRTHSPKLILDVATGTADLAIESIKLHPDMIKGIDISSKMLGIGKAKIEKKGLSGKIELLQGDSEAIPFSTDYFDAAMAAFGVRNFSNPLSGLTEMCRVLKPGGIIMILEFSRPASFPFKQIYNFYFLNILPLFGRLFSRDRRAYTYLPESVMKFPDNEAFLNSLGKAGFINPAQKRLSGGIASIYTAVKPGQQ